MDLPLVKTLAATEGCEQSERARRSEAQFSPTWLLTFCGGVGYVYSVSEASHQRTRVISREIISKLNQERLTWPGFSQCPLAGLIRNDLEIKLATNVISRFALICGTNVGLRD